MKVIGCWWLKCSNVWSQIEYLSPVEMDQRTTGTTVTAKERNVEVQWCDYGCELRCGV
jgi:hypothetical protein